MAKTSCSVEGCDRFAASRGWCIMHYHRWRRHGNTDLAQRPGGPRRGDTTTWFMKNITITHPSGCWVWKKYKNDKGYGRVQVDHKTGWAHRFSYEHFVGPIPDGLQIDHLCRNPSCINPEHLEPVTPLENTRRGVENNAAKTHCPQGHPYDDENTYWTVVGRRHCRICNRERQRASRLRKRLAA